MARELVERGRVGESANAVWVDLKRERAQHMPSTPIVSQTELVAEHDPLLPLLSEVPVAPSSPALHLVDLIRRGNRILPRFGPPATRGRADAALRLSMHVSPWTGCPQAHIFGAFNDKTGDSMGSKATPLIPFQGSHREVLVAHRGRRRIILCLSYQRARCAVRSDSGRHRRSMAKRAPKQWSASKCSVRPWM